MAIYHLHAQNFSRSLGHSAVSAAAYRAREKLEDNRTREVSDYRNKEGHLHSEIVAPKDSPDWVQDRGRLWNEVEKAEVRSDARLAREVRVALPEELSLEENKALVRDFVQREFVNRGMVADISIHSPSTEGDSRNVHAHIMLTTREIGPEGFGKKNRDWDKVETLKDWRQDWSNTVNQTLEKKGLEERIDHRTLEAQGIDRVPTTHNGPERTAELRKIQAEMSHVERQRVALEKMKGAELETERTRNPAFGDRSRDSGTQEAEREFRKAVGDSGRSPQGPGDDLTQRDLGRVEREISEIEKRAGRGIEPDAGKPIEAPELKPNAPKLDLPDEPKLGRGR